MGGSAKINPTSPNLLPLIVCMVLAHSGLTGARVAVSLAALAHGASPLFIGISIGCFGLFPLLVAVSVGRWIDRVGSAKPMQIGFAVELLGLIVAIFGPYPLALLPAALLIGTGLCIAQVSMQTTVGQATNAQNRHYAFGRVAIGASVASFIGPISAGFLIDHAGFRWAFCVMGLLATVALLWQAQLQKHSSHLFGSPVLRTSSDKLVLWDLIKDRSLLRLFLLSAALATAWDTFQFIMPIHGKSIGLSASTIGLLLGTFAGAIFIVRVMMPWLNHRFSSWKILRAVFAVCMLSYAVLPFIHSVPLLFVAAFFLGLGLGASQSNMLVLLHDAAPKHRTAEAVGLRTTFGNASAFALPTLFGAAGAVIGFSGLFALVALMMTAGSFVVHRYVRASE